MRPPWGKDLPARGLAVSRDALGIDGDDNALGAEFLGGFAHEFAARHGCRVDRDLVGACFEELANVVHGAHAAADV